MHDNVTLKKLWDQSVNYIKKLKKIYLLFPGLDLKTIVFLVLPIYWAAIILATFSQ